MGSLYRFYRTEADGNIVYNQQKTSLNFEDPASTLNYIFDILNTADEAFDGFLGFSQGMSQICMLFKAQQYFAKHYPLRHKLPYFVIDFSGLVTDHYTAEFAPGKQVHYEQFIPGVESIHFASKQDPMHFYLRMPECFEKPIVIQH